MNYNQAVKELTLMLLYLTSWTEKKPYDYKRSWKGYDFDVLNELADDGVISDSKRAKSVVIYEDGIATAKEHLKKYGLNSLLDK
jgi:hypothetical protein